MKNDIKQITFNADYQHIRVALPVRVWIQAGTTWINGLEELRTLAIENPGVSFETEANGVTFIAKLKDNDTP